MRRPAYPILSDFKRCSISVCNAKGLKRHLICQHPCPLAARAWVAAGPCDLHLPMLLKVFKDVITKTLGDACSNRAPSTQFSCTPCLQLTKHTRQDQQLG